MPLLPLPAGGSKLAGGDSPVSDDSDVIAEFSSPHRNPEVAPVRDAIAGGWTSGFAAYQDISHYAADQSDPMRATGDYLKSFAEEHSIVPRPGESDESIRDRLYVAPEIVAPEIIVEGINKILAPYTTKTCFLSELELDGMFAHDGTGTWDCFVGCDPDYADRYYADVPSSLPGAAIPSNGYPRNFFIRIPALEDNDNTVSFVLDSDPDGIFIGDGTDTSGAETDGSVALSVFADPQFADDLYAQIIGFVETIKGQGISWTLVVDTTI